MGQRLCRDDVAAECGGECKAGGGRVEAGGGKGEGDGGQPEMIWMGVVSRDCSVVCVCVCCMCSCVCVPAARGQRQKRAQAADVHQICARRRALLKTQMTGQPGESAKGFEIMVAEGKGLQVRGCVSRVDRKSVV